METDLGAGKQQHGYLHTGRDQGVRAGKGAGGAEREGRPRGSAGRKGSWAHRRGRQAQGTLRQGLRIERAEARGRGGLFWKRLGRGTSKGHTSPVG